MFSFEFFPPKTPEAAESLYQTIRELEAYMPSFVSVTYGAVVRPANSHTTWSSAFRQRRSSIRFRILLVCVTEDEINAIISLCQPPHRKHSLRWRRSAARLCHDKSQDAFQHAVDL